MNMPTIASARKRRAMPDSKTTYAKRLRREPPRAHALLWRFLRAKRLDGLKWRRRAPMFGYIVDFYCPSVGVVVEFARPAALDRQRAGALAGHGVRRLVFAPDGRMRDVVAEIRAALASPGVLA